MTVTTNFYVIVKSSFDNDNYMLAKYCYTYV